MSDQRSWRSRLAFAAASTPFALLPASHAIAARGSGGGPGTASPLTQLVMAIIVYGALGAVIVAGLVGALRHH